jgi:murein DD-endopeptidase MepM/ murein hydrolase activator NlpD
VLTQTARARLRVLLLVVVVFGAIAIVLFVLNRRQQQLLSARRSNEEHATGSVVESPPVKSPETSPVNSPEASPAPSSVPTPEETPQTSPTPIVDTSLANSYVGTLKLIIPVVGVKPEQLLDTFADARSEGRVHDAIDIPAAAGTPVVAAADGQIVKLFQSERGGTTIYQASVDQKLIFYYAHLQGYAPGIENGKFVKQGEVIAYVGDTGNAGLGNYHLHFSIAVVSDPKRYWEGTNINPYPILRGKR